jgi:Amt family ammonium transporter
MKFSAYALFIGLWSIICYSPVAHWVFSPNGWLFKRGALDFAGGTVVHINAGIAALVLALFIGKRRNWPREAMPPHSLPLTLLGTGILWFGWIGFNAGSALSAGSLASQALINTHLAAATAMLGWLLAERIRKEHATTLGGASGAIAGLVAITPCAGFVGGCEAMIIGAVAGIVCAIAVDLKFRWGYDDSLDVVGVHLVGGLTGSILLGLFASKEINPGAVDGLFHSGGWTLLINQLVASAAVLVFTGLLTLAIAWIVNCLVGLRVDEESESLGLDTTQHAESAYLLVETGLGSRGTVAKDVRPATSSAPQAS